MKQKWDAQTGRMKNTAVNSPKPKQDTENSSKLVKEEKKYGGKKAYDKKRSRTTCKSRENKE